MGSKKVYSKLVKFDEVTKILNKISIFGGFSTDQIQELFKILEKVSYKAEEYIFRKGDSPSFIYIIRSGHIKIVLDTPDGTLELIQFGVGKCFGQNSIIAIEPHPASAVAVEDTELIVLSRSALLSVFDTDKDLFSILILNIARDACRRLHQSDDILLHYVLKDR